MNPDPFAEYEAEQAALRTASGLTGNHAEFVAHAPGDIDALLAEVERLSEKPAKVAL